MKQKVTHDYSKEYDILSYNWGSIDNSRELKNVKIVIDFDKKGNVVGFELFDFAKHLEESQKEVNKILDSAKN